MRDFAASNIDTAETTIHVRCGGSGPPVLLLHGFPETSLMWREIAPRLADRHSVVCADLRGYGASGCPRSTADHAPYSKRALAQDMVTVMSRLGFERFCVAGHDRGGRVAYRAALDHPERIERLAVLDIVPIDAAWEHADDRLALGFWPWSLLAQAAPLPERLIGAAPEAVIEQALGPKWGTPSETFNARTRAAYLEQLQDPAHLHAICEEYRAAAGIDRDHDRADRDAGRQITCPVLALWSAAGPVDSWYAQHGGPLDLWRDLASNVTGHPGPRGLSQLPPWRFGPRIASASRAGVAIAATYAIAAPAPREPVTTQDHGRHQRLGRSRVLRDRAARCLSRRSKRPPALRGSQVVPFTSGRRLTSNPQAA